MQVPIDDFERRYRDDPDPWDFATSEYEQGRFDRTVACLAGRRFRRAFEPGCAGGELTARLAGHCDELVAWDGAPSVVDHARRRLAAAHVANVELDVGVIPADWPTGRFDLIVLSEIGYYFDRSALDDLITTTASSLTADGLLVATHWLGRSADHLLAGDEVHTAIDSCTELEHRDGERYPGFRIDRWDRR
ncbi:MAG: SAM-dependent methyltransferase [Ilumatobacteraceae bacterium]